MYRSKNCISGLFCCLIRGQAVDTIRDARDPFPCSLDVVDNSTSPLQWGSLISVGGSVAYKPSAIVNRVWTQKVVWNVLSDRLD